MQKNWSIDETKRLFALAKQAADEGRGLMWAFGQMSEACGHSVGSVRNYYYSQLKMFELVPSFARELGIEWVAGRRDEFVLFEEEEIVGLMENILIEKAKGRSVRSIIAEMAGGDGKYALRLQNKYRSMIAHHRDRVQKIMAALDGRGAVYYDPYRHCLSTEQKEDHLDRLAEFLGSLEGEEAVRAVKNLLGRS